jgi:hypothetical protein
MIFLSHFPEKKSLKIPNGERGLEAAVPLRSRKEKKERKKKEEACLFLGMVAQ